MYRFLAILYLALIGFQINSLAATAEVDDVRQIARLYSAAFDRNPKVNGLNFWVNNYNRGKSVIQIARQFYQSPEFTGRYGALSDDMFVRQLLKNVLGRDGTQSGIEFWTSKLAEGSSRANILKSLSDSPENIARTNAIFDPMRYEGGLWVFGSEQNGEFLAGLVEGLSYKTATLSGTTGSDGSFAYLPGESVQFLIGDTLLGEAMGQAQITPFDLAGSAVLTGMNIAWAVKTEEDPFQAVINIAVLLQSLDYDNTPENGIQIRQDVAALFNGVSLDVRQYWETFHNESTLRNAISQGSMQGLLSQAHGIVEPPVAVEKLYHALAIDPKTVGISQMQSDEVYGYLDTTEHFQYDASGNMIRHDDGTPDGFESWQYDANGQLNRYERYSAKYGTYDIAETWRYDAFAGVTRYERDYDANGKVDDTFTWNYQYDVNGNVIRMSEPEGKPESIETWQYDSRGHVTRHEEDYDANGTTDFIETMQYDARGRLTLFEEHNPEDGTPWSYQSLQYDTRGNVTLHEHNNTASGWRDLSTWQYDDRGNVTLSVLEWEHGHYGTGQLIRTWQYDSDGNLIRIEGSDANGMLKEITIWQYDANGNPTRAERENFDEYSPDLVETWQYDANGKLEQFTQEGFDFGQSIRYVETWRYDSNGNVTHRERDYGLDGTLEEINTWVYDANGNLTRDEPDLDGDGIIEGATTYQYEGTGWRHLFSNVRVWPGGDWPPPKPGPDSALLPGPDQAGLFW